MSEVTDHWDALSDGECHYSQMTPSERKILWELRSLRALLKEAMAAQDEELPTKEHHV